VALVGETIAQVRAVMVEGESGLMATAPPDRRPELKITQNRLIWPNGAEATLVSAANPEALRGPQFDCAWSDETGCPAVDMGSKQPNLFSDAKSSESSLPMARWGCAMTRCSGASCKPSWATGRSRPMYRSRL
jgi:hypothetical protein